MSSWVPEGGIGASPFPPIADYALSVGLRGTALVAPSGNVEWLCLPRLDSPSVFGGDPGPRRGRFRLGPADIEVPAPAATCPARMVLETSWGTHGGWIIVRDVLLMGPWHHDGRALHAPHRRAPTDYDAEHCCCARSAASTARCRCRSTASRRSTTAGSAGDWEYTDARLPRGASPAVRATLELTLTTDMRLGFEGPRARRAR